MHKKTKWGIFVLLAPWLFLALILLIWSLMSFIAGQIIYSAGNADHMAWINIVNVILGFFGLICVISIPMGLIGGILLIVKGVDEKNKESQTQKQTGVPTDTPQNPLNS